jgi:glutathione S-transferase
MKLYDGPGPNPKVVRMFLAEKQISVPAQAVDIMSKENRSPEHLKRNPSGLVPALELDDGSYLSEVTAICDYLEEVQPEPALIGSTPEDRARTRMWTRKVDLGICEPMANGFRFGPALGFFQDRMHCEPDIAAGLQRIAQTNLKWLDGQLDGKTWIAGDRFTLADILLYSMTSFFAESGLPLDPSLNNVGAWFERVKQRPSAQA